MDARRWGKVTVMQLLLENAILRGRNCEFDGLKRNQEEFSRGRTFYYLFISIKYLPFQNDSQLRNLIFKNSISNLRYI